MNQLIDTTDNNFGKQLCLDDYAEHAENLRKLAEHTLKEMQKDNPGLLIFPRDLNVYGDKIGDEHIFEIKDNKLTTGNIMGFVGYKNTKVRIRSRFDKGDKDFFLHYMLQKVFAINLFDLNYTIDEEEIFDFLICLFPSFLMNALRQGLYKEYQTRRYNDSNVKGRIDINRHIRHNIPFNGKVAYSTREYVYDNHVTQLVRHTIEYISKHRLQGEILRANEEVKEAVRVIIDATPSYNHNERQKIVNQNLRPLYHPYFSDYRDLQKLCLQILRHEEIKYGAEDDQVYGILFDGAWLWEEYLNTILSKINFKHPQNKIGLGAKRVFKEGSRSIFPDFYNSVMVLDAKYKGYEKWDSLQREDLYQVISYMYILQVLKGGFIVPVESYNDTPLVRTLQGYGGKMSIFGMKVEHDCQNFQEYTKAMENDEKVLVDKIIAAENLIDYNKLREMIARCKWTFAKTMPWAPHEYIVRGKCPLTEEEFLYFIDMQRKYGKAERWGKNINPYLYIDGYKYWTMGAPVEETIVMNRAKVNH